MAVSVGLVLGCGSEGTPTPAATPTRVASATAAVVLPSASATEVARTDGATVVRSFIDAINRGDRAAAEALLRADTTWERGGQCPAGQCTGLARIGQEIQRDITNRHRMDITSIETSGDTVTARIELQTNGTRAANVARVIQNLTATLSGGRIATVRLVNDVTDAAPPALPAPLAAAR